MGEVPTETAKTFFRAALFRELHEDVRQTYAGFYQFWESIGAKFSLHLGLNTLSHPVLQAGLCMSVIIPKKS